ncbi:MAG: hypothetical protein HW387_1767 [Parachlamydiales bacterium]|nr:hypothetical protein [Parachlamydiales bacterium]
MVTQLCNCRQLRSYNFTQRKNCELSKELNKISALILPSFDDVVYRADQTFVMLESLKTPPQGDFGDLTGDHGKQVSIFLKHCLQKKLISSVGSVLDVGGQNTSTVELISQVLNKPSLPSLIIDLSSVTPAITPSRPNIKYAIGDACRFFSSEKYQAFVSDIITDAPSLVLFNNILNVLNATDGWATLQVAWSRLRTGDYLFISGLVPEQLEKHRMKKFHEIDGIVEFRYKDRFYKSALSPDFADFVEVRLKNVSVLIKETFKQTVEIKLPQLTEEVHGYRLLALRKA